MAVQHRGVTLLLAGPLFAFFASSRFKELGMRYLTGIGPSSTVKDHGYPVFQGVRQAVRGGARRRRRRQ
jgi:hypothetical protein